MQRIIIVKLKLNNLKFTVLYAWVNNKKALNFFASNAINNVIKIRYKNKLKFYLINKSPILQM